jgi:hypothetical protein
MSLADFVAVGLAVFQNYILFWAVLFVVACTLMSVLVGLAMMLLSRIL